MATVRKTRFSRRVPDHVTDELVNVLSDGKTYEFNVLFGLVYENLKLKNAVSGGEEMLRLRSYEKLQNLVGRGLVEKKLNALVECNPLLGKIVLKVVTQVLSGRSVAPVMYMEDKVFTVHNAAAALPSRKY